MQNGLRVCAALLVLSLSACTSTPDTQSLNGNFNTSQAAKTRVSLGLTYLKNGNYIQAKKNLDQAFEYAPNSADVNYALAYYYQIVGEQRRADSYYSTALELAPDNGDIANSYGAFMCQVGDYEKAKSYFLHAVNIRQYANSAQTYENLGLCAQSQGHIEDAIGYFNNALNHQPTRAKSLFLVTELYILTEQWSMAETMLAKYKRVAPVSPDVLWMSFDIAKGQENWDAARQIGEALVRDYPQSPFAERYENLLESLPQLTVIEPQTSSVSSNENNVLSSYRNDFHIVKAGENLYRISLMHNIKLATLQSWNQLDNASAIVAGMKLWLVPPEQQQ